MSLSAFQLDGKNALVTARIEVSAPPSPLVSPRRAQMLLVTAVIRVREASAPIFERWDAAPPISPATSLKHLPVPL